jgi:hypothetical protein
LLQCPAPLATKQLLSAAKPQIILSTSFLDGQDENCPSMNKWQYFIVRLANNNPIQRKDKQNSNHQ